MTLRVINVTRGTVLARKAKPARSFWQRFKGLIGKKELLPDEGLVIQPCASVHTFFMSFPIDLVFYDQSNRVVAVYEKLAPFRITPFYKTASGVVELPAGTISRSGTIVGDFLHIERF